MLNSLDVYVPLHFSVRPPRPGQSVAPTESFPLETFMNALLFDSIENVYNCFSKGSRPNKGTRVFFIQGFAGAGKSLFCWRSMQYFDAEVTKSRSKKTCRVPIVISLPSVKTRVLAAPVNFLMQGILDAFPALKTSFDTLDQEFFTTLPFLFLLDSVDELSDAVAINNVNRIYNPEKWPASLFVLTCRSEVLDSTVISSALPPRQRFPDGPPQTTLMTSMYLLPFSATQREAFITAFAQKYTDLNVGWTAAKYTAALKQFSELEAFLQEPLQLYLVLTVLPILVAGKENGSHVDRCAKHNCTEHAIYVFYQDNDLAKAQELATAIEQHPDAIRKGVTVFLKDVCGHRAESHSPVGSVCSQQLSFAKVIVPVVSSSVDVSTEAFVATLTAAMSLHKTKKTKVCPLYLSSFKKSEEALLQTANMSTTTVSSIKMLDKLQGKILKPEEDWSLFVLQIVQEFRTRKYSLIVNNCSPSTHTNTETPYFCLL